eukprot:4330140-Amphidinium_carterae.1
MSKSRNRLSWDRGCGCCPPFWADNGRPAVLLDGRHIARGKTAVTNGARKTPLIIRRLCNLEDNIELKAKRLQSLAGLGRKAVRSLGEAFVKLPTLGSESAADLFIFVSTAVFNFNRTEGGSEQFPLIENK